MENPLVFLETAKTTSSLREEDSSSLERSSLETEETSLREDSSLKMDDSSLEGSKEETSSDSSAKEEETSEKEASSLEGRETEEVGFGFPQAMRNKGVKNNKGDGRFINRPLSESKKRVFAYEHTIHAREKKSLFFCLASSIKNKQGNIEEKEKPSPSGARHRNEEGS